MGVAWIEGFVFAWIEGFVFAWIEGFVFLISYFSKHPKHTGLNM